MMKKGTIFIGSLLGLMAIGWVILPLYVWASGLHTHIPRGPDSGAFQDTVEVDDGDKFLAAHGEIDTVKGTIWVDVAATELIPTFSAINSAFSSALSGYSLNVTGANLSILTGAGETALHSHANGNGNGGMANNDTTDTLLVNEFFKLNNDFYFPEQAFAEHNDFTAHAVHALQVFDGVLYAGVENSFSDWAKIYAYTGEGTWTEAYDLSGLVAVDDIDNISMESFKGRLYVGVETGDPGGGDILTSWNGTSWSMAYDGTYEEVSDLQVYGDSLYAGMGYGTEEGEVLATADGDTWVISLDGTLTGDVTVKALAVYNGQLYAATSTILFAGEGSLWRKDADTWTKIGVPAAGHDILSMHAYQGLLYLGMGSYADQGDLWTWDGLAFNEMKANSGSDKREIMALEVYNDKLYVGLSGSSTGNGKVYHVNGNRWKSVAILGAGIQSEIRSLHVCNDRLWAGTGNHSVGKGLVYDYYTGYKTGPLPLVLGSHPQHFAKKVTFGDSVIFSGPVTLKDSVVYSGPLYSDDIFVGDGDGIVIGHNAHLGSDIPNAETQILGTGIADASIVLGRWSADIGCPTVQFYKSRNATLGEHTVITTGDDLGYIRVYADDGTEDVESARIAFDTEGTIGAGNIPGIISFHTMEDGGSPVVVESFRINSLQDIIVTAGQNMGLGTATFGTGGTQLLAFSNGTSPSTSPANSVQLWAADQGGSSELIVRDEAGNTTVLSANVENYPATLEVSIDHPYVTKHTQQKAGVTTYTALHKMVELVQQMAYDGGYLARDEKIIEREYFTPQDHEAEEAMWLQRSIDDSTTADIRKAFAVALWDSLDAVRAGKRLAYKKAVARGALILPDTTMPAFPDTHIVIPKHHVPRELPRWIQKLP